MSNISAANGKGEARPSVTGVESAVTPGVPFIGVALAAALLCVPPVIVTGLLTARFRTVPASDVSLTATLRPSFDRDARSGLRGSVD